MDLTMYKMNDWQNYNDHGHDLVWIQDLSSAEVKSEQIFTCNTQNWYLKPGLQYADILFMWV